MGEDLLHTVAARTAPAAEPNHMAERFGLTTGHHEGVDGYVDAAHVEALVGAFGLVPDLEGDVTLRRLGDVPGPRRGGRFRSRW